MEKLQVECQQYVLYSPNTLKYITDEMHPILLSKIEEYKKLFDVMDYRQLIINYFDEKDKFRNFIYSLRGEKESLPQYAVGTFDRGMINAFIANDIPVNSSQYKKKLYMASHELFHIMYKELVLKNDFSKRIVWYDEGMAQFMSGEKENLLDYNSFKNYYLEVKENTKVFPNLNSIKHGNGFCNDLYNGYDLSYLCIRYLQEILSNDDFKSLMTDFNRILQYGEIILGNMFEYYDNFCKQDHTLS